jgi:hypothetical protein
MKKPTSNIGTLLALLALATWPGAVCAQSTYVKVADEWGTIQPGGPRIAANGNRFWNVQGADAGANASSGTLRFYLAELVTRLNTDFPGGWQIEKVTLVAEHDDSAFSMPGGISVFHFTNDELAITNGADSFFPNPPPDAPPGNFGMLPVSSLVFDDTGTSGGQPVRVLLNDFVSMADMGTVTHVNDYMFSAQGDDNLDVLGTPGGLVDPSGAINVMPHYDLSFPTANPDDSLTTFQAELEADMGDWIAAGFDTVVSDIEEGTDALSFIFATTDPNSTASATYKGNAFTNRFPPRLYIEASGMGTPGLLGDYNNNGSVDAADYVLWRDGGPLQNEGASPNDVDQTDYDFWRARFGEVVNGPATASAVPEPASACLAVFAIIGARLIGRRSHVCP